MRIARVTKLRIAFILVNFDNVQEYLLPTTNLIRFRSYLFTTYSDAMFLRRRYVVFFPKVVAILDFFAALRFAE